MEKGNRDGIGDSPAPLSSRVCVSIQCWACSIFPSRCTAALAGRLLATALLVLDCMFCSAVAICLAKALASGVSPLPLSVFTFWKAHRESTKDEHTQREREREREREVQREREREREQFRERERG